MDITDKELKEINSYLLHTLSPKRYEHSLSTAETAQKLCIKYSLNPDKGYFTGLIHDIAREYNSEKTFEICRRNGEIITEWEKKSPVLLHGKAGAALLKERFNIQDEEILDAVRVHTTGCTGMSSLAKILFISDYIEPCRKHITEVYIESLDFSRIDSVMKSVVESILEYLKSSSRETAGPTLELLKELKVCEETVNRL